MSAYASARIPYGAYWSTPFCRWQGALSDHNALKLAAHTAKVELARRGIAPEVVEHAVLGMTVPQEKSFWGVPWAMALIGNPTVTGPTLAQACATSARCLAESAAEIAAGDTGVSLVLTADRTSNSPVMVLPNPKAASGAPTIENWVLDNFRQDPHALVAMVETAENCARDWSISTEEQHALVTRRYAQYQDAVAEDGAFLKRFMTLPFEVPDPAFRKTVATMTGDEGIHATTAEGLAKLKPVVPGGTVTFGGQTHPADGNAGLIVAHKDRAGALSREPGIEIRILSIAQARERKAYMPAAPVKAAKRALDQAGLRVDQMAAIKSHNPFVVNDIVFARETGADAWSMNNFGCSLVWGHPQGPTGLRLVIELIEELVMKGGGRGLFHGCAAGDTAMAAVIEVRDTARG